MKILVILSRFPYPLEKGDKLRAYHQIRHLSKNNRIYLAALSDIPVSGDDIKQLRKFCEEIEVFPLNKPGIIINTMKAFLSGKPFQAGYFFNSSTRKKIESIARAFKPDHIYCQLVRTASYVENITNIPKTIDYQDAFSKGVERRIDTVPSIVKPVFRLEYNRLLKYERDVFSQFDNKVIISEQDKQLIDHPRKEEIKVVPNGVDFSFFQPKLSVENTSDLLFIGNMHYPPNVRAAVYIAERILPIVKHKYPDIKLMIAGANPTAKVRALGSENVTVTGWVDDIRDCFAGSGIFIAPMQLGIGLQNKLLEAMSMGLPCISSELANNALGAKAGEQILIGKKPKDYAKHIFRLLEDKDYSDSIAAAGKEFVKSKYDWDTVTAQLESLFESKGKNSI